MNTRDDLMRILGLSYRQLRERLDALAAANGLLAGQVVKGPHGRLEYSSAVVEMLRDLDTLAENDGKDLRQAAADLASSVHGNVHEKVFAVNGNLSGKDDKLAIRAELLEQRLLDKDEIIRRLETDNARLWQLVTDLKDQLALPRPKEERPRRRWWLPWRSRN